MEFDPVAASELTDWLKKRKQQRDIQRAQLQAYKDLYEEFVMKKEPSFTSKVYNAACQVLVDELTPRFENRAIITQEAGPEGVPYILVKRFKSLQQVWVMKVDWHTMDKMLTFNTYPDIVARKIEEVL